jgi:glycosyltransferase involved in cell wall biosynthesis
MATELRRELVTAGWSVDVPADTGRVNSSAESAAALIRAQARSNWTATTRNHTVTHSLYYDLPVWGGGRRITTVHDMIHERFGAGSHRLRVAKRRSVRRADLVVCDSEHTRRDLLADGLEPIRSAVVALGVSAAILDGNGVADPFDGQPYLIYVGDRAGYKNFELLVASLAATPDLDHFGLVIVGGPPMSPDNIATIVQQRRGSPVVHRRSVDDATLGDLYRGGAALVVTSRYEGFGLSVLEAMACGCAVASTRCGSLSEFDDGLSYGFDASSIDGCAAAVVAAAHADDARRGQGITHARTFTWRLTAEHYADLYDASRA